MKEKPGADRSRNAAVETRVAGAGLAPGVRPGLPKMVMMMPAHNNPAASQNGQHIQVKRSSRSIHYAGKGTLECQTGKATERFCQFTAPGRLIAACQPYFAAALPSAALCYALPAHSPLGHSAPGLSDDAPRLPRNSLKKYHADLAGQLLGEVGYDAATIARVQELVQQLHLKDDPEVQLLEDVICLVFLEYYFLPFAARHPAEKVIEIVRKTWPKMTERGHALALQLPLPPEAITLISKALN